MPLPPDEPERRLYIEGWMAGAAAVWGDLRQHVAVGLRMVPKQCRDMIVAALTAVGLTDLLRASEPDRHESDANADYERRQNKPRG